MTDHTWIRRDATDLYGTTLHFTVCAICGIAKGSDKDASRDDTNEPVVVGIYPFGIGRTH